MTDDERLDRAFLALADPVRRAIVARLSTGAATVNELAEPFAITVQAVSRHIHVLETAGLVTRSRDAQRRPVHLDPAALEELTAWIDRYRLTHEQRFRSLDAVLRGPQPAGAAHVGRAQPRPGQSRPEQTRPEQTRPEQSRPEQTRPEQSQPEEKKR